jgi:hypothetical protein
MRSWSESHRAAHRHGDAADHGFGYPVELFASIKVLNDETRRDADDFAQTEAGLRGELAVALSRRATA